MKFRRSECPLFLAVSLFLLGPWQRPATAQLLGPEFQVNSYTTNSQYLPTVAASASGNFVVAWTSYLQDGSSMGIFGQRFNSAGSKAGSEFQVNTYTTSSQYWPSVAVDGSGNFVVVWASDSQDGYPRGGQHGGVFGQRFSALGSRVGIEFQVNTYTTSRQSSPAVAADGSGNFVVAWESEGQVDSFGDIFGQRFNSAGSRVGSEFRVNSTTIDGQGGTAVAAVGSGNFVVVWNSNLQDGSFGGVFGQRFNSVGTPAGIEFQVNTYTTSSQGSPAVAADGSGNFVVVWDGVGQNDADGGVFGQRFNSAGTKLGSEFRVNTYVVNNQYRPAVSADGSGNFVVVWQSRDQDGSSSGVFGQRFNSVGTPVGSELQINTYATASQRAPAVAADGSGRFVVAWTSYGQDGSDNGIFGQRLAAPLFEHGFEANPPFWSDTTATMCSGFCIPSGTPDGICFCDPACLTFGDCCLDACRTCGLCAP